MSTNRMYKQNTYLRNLHTKVAKITANKGGFEIVFHSSNFFPVGGGQPADTGIIRLSDGSTLEVIDTYDSHNGEDVIHLVKDAGSLKVGDEVEIEIDWDRRYRNMQRHSGEHVLSGAFYITCGGANKGFHMGENYITIDIDLGGAHLTEDVIEETERLANHAIWDNLPVTTDYFPSAAEASEMPVRKAINIDGEISVVTVGDVSSPFDCVACCGTHVARTGEIGIIKIFKVESNRGMNRVYFDCGEAAYNASVQDSRILRQVSDRLSCGNEDVLAKLELRDEREGKLKASYARLAARFKDMESASIAKRIIDSSEISGLSEPAFTRSFFRFDIDLLGSDDIVKLGYSVVEKLDEAGIQGDMLIALVNTEDNTVILFARGGFKAGELVKNNAREFNGRGGGRPDNARASFQSEGDVEGFLEKLSHISY